MTKTTKSSNHKKAKNIKPSRKKNNDHKVFTNN